MLIKPAQLMCVEPYLVGLYISSLVWLWLKEFPLFVWGTTLYISMSALPFG